MGLPLLNSNLPPTKRPPFYFLFMEPCSNGSSTRTIAHYLTAFRRRFTSNGVRSGSVRCTFEVCSGIIQNSFGDRSEFVRALFEGRGGIVQSPFEINSKSVRGAYEVRSGSVRGSYGG